jgi:hypothetical protein
MAAAREDIRGMGHTANTNISSRRRHSLREGIGRAMVRDTTSSSSMAGVALTISSRDMVRPSSPSIRRMDSSRLRGAGISGTEVGRVIEWG